MAVLAVTGLVYAHGVDGHVWSEIWGAAHAADGVWGGALGTGVGAWLGAVPIPLDWYCSLSLSLSVGCVVKMANHGEQGPSVAGVPRDDCRRRIPRVCRWVCGWPVAVGVWEADRVFGGGAGR